MKNFNWLPYLPLLIVALTGAVAWGQVSNRVENLREDQTRVEQTVTRSIRNEAQILNLGAEIKRTQSDIERTQTNLDAQQREIILLLRRQQTR